MQFENGPTINTPHDDTADYDPDWRWQIARYWAGCKDTPALPYEVITDQYINDCHQYLKSDKAAPQQTSIGRAIQRAHNWNAATMISKPKFRIEPLLLTGATFDVIAQDMGTTAENIQVYERLFFNIRTDAGALMQSCYTRTAFALPGIAGVTPGSAPETIWRAAGSQMGYIGLVTMWNWVNPAGLQDPMSNEFISQELLRLTHARLLNRVLTGDIINFDLSQMFVHYINNERLRLDSGKTADVESVASETMQNILMALAPKMVDTALSVDQDYQEEVARALEARAKADYAVKRQMITDLGEGKGRESFEQKTKRLFIGAAGD